MKPNLFNDPFLLDFLKVAAQLPEDEQRQLQLLTGHGYEIDGCAIGNFTVAGPKWVIKLDDGVPLCVGGFVPQRPGVWRDFLLTTAQCWSPEYGSTVTRILRRIMTRMLEADGVHRLETVVPAERLSSRPELEKWYKVLGYKKEAPLWRYCADGSDAFSFARVRR